MDYGTIQKRFETLYPELVVEWLILQSNPPKDCLQIHDGDTCVAYRYGHNLRDIVMAAEDDVKKYVAAKGAKNMTSVSQAPGCE